MNSQYGLQKIRAVEDVGKKRENSLHHDGLPLPSFVAAFLEAFSLRAMAAIALPALAIFTFEIMTLTASSSAIAFAKSGRKLRTTVKHE